MPGVVAMLTADQGDLSPWSTTAGYFTRSNEKARTGSYAFKSASGNSAWPAWGQRNVPPRADYYARWGWYILGVNAGAPPMVRFQETNPHVELLLLADGRIQAKRSSTVLGTSTYSMPFNAWQCLEAYVKVHDTAGVITVKVNGVPFLELSGTLDTRNGDTDGVITNLSFGALGGAYDGSTHYIDDILIRDDAWPGRGGLYILPPTADGTNNAWTPSTGNRYACVDELPAVATDNIYTDVTVLNTKQDFALADLPGTAYSAISCVSVHAVARLAAAGSGNIRTYGISNAITSSGPATPLDASLTHIDHFMTLDPNGSVAWTKAAVDALVAGVETI